MDEHPENADAIELRRFLFVPFARNIPTLTCRQKSVTKISAK